MLLWTIANHESGSFDVILSGVVPPATLSHNAEYLGEFVRILQPSGRLYLIEPIVTNGGRWSLLVAIINLCIDVLTVTISTLRLVQKLPVSLRLSGFVGVSEVC